MDGREDQLPVLASDVDRSDFEAGSSTRSPTQELNPRSQTPTSHPSTSSSLRSKTRATTNFLAKPPVLTLTGLAILIVGIALVVASATIPTQTTRPRAKSPAVNSDGIPLNATRPKDTAENGIKDCTIKLGNWDTYKLAAGTAEKDTFGAEVTNSSPDQLKNILLSLPDLLVGVSFWVPVSETFPVLDSLQSDIDVQIQVLNQAFASAGISFRFDSITVLPSTDSEIKKCGDRQQGLPLLLAQNLVNSTGVHVLLCEPEGVNGATPVLGSEYHQAPSQQSALIILRRGALWYSRTSLVHQLGHAFGLPHPYPDTESCRYDADTIIDTQQQFRPSVGCSSDKVGALCLQPGSIQAPPSSSEAKDNKTQLTLPPYNFMDITNDTCRQVFTAGQILRMRAMLSSLRPQLYSKALLQYQKGEVLMSTAYQSGLPTVPLVNLQMNSAQQQQRLISKKASSSAKSPSAVGEIAALYTDSRELALQALNDPIGGENSHKSIAVGNCACIGPDSSGRVYWSGVFDAAYNVDGIEIVQPWDLAEYSSASSSSSSGTGSSNGDNNNAESILAQLAANPVVNVYIGYSNDYTKNSVCTSAPVELDSLSKTIMCDQKSLIGRVITVEAVSQGSELQQMCLCSVKAVSNIYPAVEVEPSLTAGFPGGILDTSGSTATQSSLFASSIPSDALAPRSSRNSLSATVSSTTSTLFNCSTTQAEDAPWWSLNLGIDPYRINGVRFQTPFICQNFTAPIGCLAPASNLTLDIYITQDALNPNRSLIQGVTSNEICASGIVPRPGVLTDVDCGRALTGRYVTIAARGIDSVNSSSSIPAQSPLSSSPAAKAKQSSASSTQQQQQLANKTKQQVLSLCGVQIIGSVEASIAALVPDQPVWHEVRPSSLLPGLTLPIDNNVKTCLQAPQQQQQSTGEGVGTLWQLALAQTPIVHAIQVTLGDSSSSSSLSLVSTAQVGLLNGLSELQWSTVLNAQNLSSKVVIDLPTPMAVSAIQVLNFASLCDVKLYIGSSTSAGSSNIREDMTMWMSSPAKSVYNRKNAWTAVAVVADQQQQASFNVVNVPAVVDDDVFTCGVVSSSRGQSTQLKIDFGASARVSRFRILSNVYASNLTAALIPRTQPITATFNTDAQAQFSSVGYKESSTFSAIKCGESGGVGSMAAVKNNDGFFDVAPWVVKELTCDGGSSADSIGVLIKSDGYGSMNTGGESVLSICDVQVYAEAPWTQRS